MIIYLTAITVFMVECLTMYFIYFSKQKEFKQELTNAYKSKYPIDKFFYFIMIPCLNEGKVIKDTLQHLIELNGQKHIIVIDDDSDDDTVKQAKSIAGPITILQRKFPNARTGKGDSLNSAMPTIQKLIDKQHLDPKYCLVGVIDGDGILSGNSIYKLNDVFGNEDIDAVQLRVKMKTPKNILQTFQDIEFFVVNHLMQLLRTNLNAVALCGNGQFFRYSSVYKKMGIHPWGDALLEDYELTLRLELHGLKIKYITDAYVDQEALLSMKSLIKQRARWSQGGWDCWKYFKAITQSKIMSNAQKFDVYCFFIQPVLNIFADFSIIYLTIKFIIQYHEHPEFLFVSMISLAILGLLFGTIFTMIYIHEMRINDQANVVIQESDMINEKLHLRKAFLSIGLMSYIYIMLFFSLILSTYHMLIGQNAWDKTKRI
ncbi:glycosyltransferase [Companilactobacillus kimchiensis]|uniref:Glycosyltransferase n=1 Tax=Companilactobacillus kimchiensis TaxID=993692 RepID=A0A0R2LG18_9LACO|nr:glycosyltransferase family 2 protein [Companilactobacillus kimchiensis]KRO00820.1 hypothetical protein IV57_GL000140 [Companilactobacillus kimchiensis]